ncbi:hypothetical protein E2C01_009815 [Portunus trituberculatus]|uniref:Uncharacterized protein n=1 Tax=Portunus trituberculatus TaxID=210409 RepID=A0A5B7D6Q6_PORTR|nr:hypothetical protein [Portunus trituberculatus]
MKIPLEDSKRCNIPALRKRLKSTIGLIRATQDHIHKASGVAATDLKNALKRKAAKEVGSTGNSEIFRWVTRHQQHGTDLIFIHKA